MTTPQPLRPPMAEPQAQPSAPMPAQLGPTGAVGADFGTGNPILDELHQKADALHASLSPPAKEAVAQSGILGGLMPSAPAATPSIGPSAPDSDMAPSLGTGSKVSFPFLGPSGRTPAEAELQRKQSTGSGISQIHNPFLRTLASIGEGIGSALPITRNILPFIPGTEAHHQQLVGEGQQQVNIESAEQKAADATKDAESKRALEAAQAEHATAQAQQTKEQTPHTLQTDQGIMQWNPETKRFDIPAGQSPAKEEVEGKTITTDQGIMQWDPKTKTYSIKAGNAPEKEGAAEKTLQDADGVWYHIGKDNTATPITVGGNPFQGKTGTEKTATPEQQFLDEYQKDHPGSKIAEAEKAFKAIQPPEKPERPPQALMIGPGGKAMIVRPGTKVPEGAMTPAGVNSTNVPTSQTRTMAETAPKVLDLAARVEQLVDQQAKTLGPAASRWNEFMAGKVGAPNPEFTKLRTDVGLLQTALMRMHVGARGGEQMMQHFQSLIDTSKQSPENLKAALEEITAYAKAVQSEGHKGGGEGQNGGGYKAGDTRDVNGIKYVRDDKGSWTPQAKK